MPSRAAKGVLVARSLHLKKGQASTLLELQTTAGEKIKIMKVKAYLPSEIIPGMFYRFTNLRSIEVPGSNDVAFLIKELNQVHKEINPGITIPWNYKHNFSGKVTAADKDFLIYEVDDGKSLVLSYVSWHVERPAVEVGDHVEVYGAHLYSCSGRDYLVLCFQSFINVRRTSEERRFVACPIFAHFAEIYGLNIQTLLWLRENLTAVKACLSHRFLESLGVQKTDLVYGDILIMLLSSNEEIKEKIRRSPVVRNPFKEFFYEPHNCMAMKEDLQLPSKPWSLQDCQDLMQEADVSPYDYGTNSIWNFHTIETRDNRPVLAYVDISTDSQRLCLVDGTGLQLPLVIIPPRQYVNRDCSAVHKKIVLIENPLLVIEEFFESCEIDPGAEELPAATQKYLYLAANLDDIKVMGPGNDGFSQWKLRVNEYVDDNVASSIPLVPLQANSTPLQSFTTERYVVLSKTPLERLSNGDLSTYIMVKKVPDGSRGSTADSLCTSFKLQRPHTDFYDLIPSSGEVEIRFPQGEAETIKNKRFLIPSTYALTSKLKTVLYARIPPEVEMFVVNPSWKTSTYVYGLEEAVNSSHLKDVLFSLSGTIKRRTHEDARFAREKASSGHPHFGLPGKSGVIILDLSDNAAPESGMGARIYLSWQNTYRYPLGLLPGAVIKISFVSKTMSKQSGKPYFRSTNLSQVEILKPAGTERSSNVDFVELPTGQWTYPEDLSVGSGGWCTIDDVHLHKLNLDAVCQHCNEPCSRGMCPSCMRHVETKLKLSSRVMIENLDSTLLIHVGDENVRVLLELPPNIWKALLTLANYAGDLFFKKRDNVNVGSANVSELAGLVFSEFCGVVLHPGLQYQGFFRRLKPVEHVNAADIFCAKLQPACLKTALRATPSTTTRSVKRRKMN